MIKSMKKSKNRRTTEPISFNIYSDQIETLDELSRKLGISKNQILRTAIDEYIKKIKKR